MITHLGSGVQIATPRTLPVPWWDWSTPIAAYQPKGADSQADSYIDKSGNGNDAAPGVAPSWTADLGWTFNGTTEYLVTGVVTPTTYTILMQYGGTATSGLKALFGATDDPLASDAKAFIAAQQSSLMSVWCGGFVFNSLRHLSGNYGVAAGIPYRDGVADSSTIASPTDGPSVQDCYIGAYNNQGSPASFAQATVTAFGIWGRQLTPSEVAEVAAEMARR